MEALCLFNYQGRDSSDVWPCTTMLMRPQSHLLVAAEVGKALVPSRNLITYLRFAPKTRVFLSDNTMISCQFSVSHLGNHDPVPSVDCFLLTHTQMNGVLAFFFLLSSFLSWKVICCLPRRHLKLSNFLVANSNVSQPCSM